MAGGVSTPILPARGSLVGSVAARRPHRPATGRWWPASRPVGGLAGGSRPGPSARRWPTWPRVSSAGWQGTTVSASWRIPYDWFLDMAIARAGLISVPIYETSRAGRVDRRRRRRACGHHRERHAGELVRGAVAGIEQPVRVLALDSDAITTIVQAGSGVSPSQVDQRSNALTVDDVYSIIYTSGTTGRPKGVEPPTATPSASRTGCATCPSSVGTNVRLLLFLPLAHRPRPLPPAVPGRQGVLGHTPTPRPSCPTCSPSLPPTSWPSHVLGSLQRRRRQAGSGAKLLAVPLGRQGRHRLLPRSGHPQGPSRSSAPGARHGRPSRLPQDPGTHGAQCPLIISGGGPLGQRLGTSTAARLAILGTA